MLIYQPFALSARRTREMSHFTIAGHRRRVDVDDVNEENIQESETGRIVNDPDAIGMEVSQTEDPLEMELQDDELGADEPGEGLGHSYQRTVHDIIADDTDMRPSVWIEALTKDPQPLGGVHGGKIVLQMYCTSDTLYLQGTRTSKLICGGQIYITNFKRIIKKNSLRRFRRLGTLPAMVQDLLSSSKLFHSSPRTENQKKSVVSIIKLMHHTFRHAKSEISTSQGSNSVRLEFFFMSTLVSDEPDFEFPSFNPADFCVLSCENRFFSRYGRIMKEISDVLMKTFVERPLNTNYDMLQPATKRMLVLASELACQMIEVHPFSGKITSKISRLVKEMEGEQCMLWHVPESLLMEIPDEDKELTNLRCGLTPQVLTVPQFAPDSIQRPSQDDITNRLPEWVQNYQDITTGNMILPNQYMTNLGKVLGLFWSSVHQQQVLDTPDDQEQPEPPPVSFFDTPPYRKVALLNSEVAEELIQSLSRIVANSYDFEWFTINRSKNLASHKKRRSENPQANCPRPDLGRVEDFPTTKATLQAYIERVEFLQVETGELYEAGDTKRTVKTVLQLVKKMFLFEGGVGTTDGRWKSSLVRHTVYFIYKLLKEVRKLCRDDPDVQGENNQPKYKFTCEYFNKILATTMTEFRRKEGDTSQAIIWNTFPSKMYPTVVGCDGWLSQPMLLDIQLAAFPEVHPREDCSDDSSSASYNVDDLDNVNTFPHQRRLMGIENTFSKNYMTHKRMSILKVIALRFMHFTYTGHYLSKGNKLSSQRLLDLKFQFKFNHGQDLFLHHFFYTPTAYHWFLKNAYYYARSLFGEVESDPKNQNKASVIAAVKLNKRSWTPRLEDCLKDGEMDYSSMFQYPVEEQKSVARQIRRELNQLPKKKAVQEATKKSLGGVITIGYLTDAFHLHDTLTRSILADDDESAGTSRRSSIRGGTVSVSSDIHNVSSVSSNSLTPSVASVSHHSGSATAEDSHARSLDLFRQPPSASRTAANPSEANNPQAPSRRPFRPIIWKDSSEDDE